MNLLVVGEQSTRRRFRQAPTCAGDRESLSMRDSLLRRHRLRNDPMGRWQQDTPRAYLLVVARHGDIQVFQGLRVAAWYCDENPEGTLPSEPDLLHQQWK